MYYDPNDPEILLAFRELELAKQELRRREEQKLFRSLREAERAGYGREYKISRLRRLKPFKPTPKKKKSKKRSRQPRQPRSRRPQRSDLDSLISGLGGLRIRPRQSRLRQPSVYDMIKVQNLMKLKMASTRRTPHNRQSRAQGGGGARYRMGRSPPSSRTPSDDIFIGDEYARHEAHCRGCRRIIPLETMRRCTRENCNNLFCYPCLEANRPRGYCDQECQREARNARRRDTDARRRAAQERQVAYGGRSVASRTRGRAVNCSICVGDSPNIITPCGHEFHEDCVREWVGRGGNCPICRGTLAMYDVIRSPNRGRGGGRRRSRSPPRRGGGRRRSRSPRRRR